jgi:hypothetical protein
MGLNESQIQIDKSPIGHKNNCFQNVRPNPISNVGTALIGELCGDTEQENVNWERKGIRKLKSQLE